MILIDFRFRFPEEFNECFFGEGQEAKSSEKKKWTKHEEDHSEKITKRYRRQFPKCLQGGLLTPQKPLYLYQIRFKRLDCYYKKDSKNLNYFNEGNPTKDWAPGYDYG
jgi:hypothetical protein